MANNHHLVCHVSYTASPNQSLVRPLVPSSALVRQSRHVAPGSGCVCVYVRALCQRLYVRVAARVSGRCVINLIGVKPGRASLIPVKLRSLSAGIAPTLPPPYPRTTPSLCQPHAVSTTVVLYGPVLYYIYGTIYNPQPNLTYPLSLLLLLLRNMKLKRDAFNSS